MPRQLRTEASIEGAVVRYARSRGVKSIKVSVNGPRGTAGWPDRMFLALPGRVLWVEFKRPGARPTPLQTMRMSELKELGFRVEVCDNVALGKRLINELAGGGHDEWV